MAESLLAPVIAKLAVKAGDVLVQRVTRMWGIDDNRERLERRLVYVQSLLADAEAKSEANVAVRVWMKALKVAAYWADDVLDDFQYEALRLETQNHRSMASKVMSYLTSHNRLVFRHKASGELKRVLDKIEELVEEMTKYELEPCKEMPQVPYRQTHSALDESTEIFGRDNDKEVVVKLLLDQIDQQKVQVLPIIGMGGLGKTTLAKMVYDSHIVQNHFELKMWHCVSENFEVTPLVRSVIELATNGRCELPDNIELLRRRLQEVIGRKRFLLILDDVWNEDEHKWEDSLKPLLCSSIGGSGSMIIVTSRSREVATIMGTLPPRELVPLSEDDSWKLFSMKAFSKGVQEQAELVAIGRRIINKCKGLPLALKTVGGLMSSKQQVHEWEAIADCNISDTVRGKDEVMSVLKLSYNHLPAEMKQCFAFCAVFPKDYKMEKDMLIQLWIANGYIHEEGTMNSEQKGELIFNYLTWRSFLQDVRKARCFISGSFYGYGSEQEIYTCKMHDLMHDLANDIASECATVKDLIQQKVRIKDVRHLHISETQELEKFSLVFKGTASLSTLLTPELSYKDLTELKLMPSRALCCLCEDPFIKSRHLIRTTHLRYLDLSNSEFVRLPDSICMLYNLQTLSLNSCTKLQYLPEDMRSMRKLIHLYLFKCHNLKRMPPKLGLLHNLHTLTTFVVDTEDGCGIEELKDLRQLGNRLELCNLRKAKSGSSANLQEKYKLFELLLYWGRGYSYKPTIDEAINDNQLLESLVPHGQLQILEVHGYGGLEISQWMRDPLMFQCLRELVMNNCPRCKDVPIVWMSSCLEHLSLHRMDNITILCQNNIEVEAGRHNSSLPVFPKLKRVELCYLPQLVRWTENSAAVTFPLLEELTVHGCNKLASLSDCRHNTFQQIFPKLKRLELCDLPQLIRWTENSEAVTFPLLEELTIDRCNKLASLPDCPVLSCLSYHSTSVEGLFSMSLPLGSWPSLVQLKVGGPVNIVLPLEEDQGVRPLETLRMLIVSSDDSFLALFAPKVRDCFVFVVKLYIHSCLSIVRWPVDKFRCLPALQSLCISGCNNLVEVGSSSEEMLWLPQLKELSILACGSLQEIYNVSASLEDVVIDTNNNLVALSGLVNLDKLRRLKISRCSWLKALPDEMDALTSLEHLWITDCPGIEKFPHSLLQQLTALKSLAIWRCPNLERRCREGGEYFDLVSSIPNLDIRATEPPSRKKFVSRLLPSCRLSN